MEKNLAIKEQNTMTKNVHIIEDFAKEVVELWKEVKAKQKAEQKKRNTAFTTMTSSIFKIFTILV